MTDYERVTMKYLEVFDEFYENGLNDLSESRLYIFKLLLSYAQPLKCLNNGKKNKYGHYFFQKVSKLNEEKFDAILIDSDILRVFKGRSKNNSSDTVDDTTGTTAKFIITLTNYDGKKEFSGEFKKFKVIPIKYIEYHYRKSDTYPVLISVTEADLCWNTWRFKKNCSNAKKPMYMVFEINRPDLGQLSFTLTVRELLFMFLCYLDLMQYTDTVFDRLSELLSYILDAKQVSKWCFPNLVFEPVTKSSNLCLIKSSSLEPSACSVDSTLKLSSLKKINSIYREVCTNPLTLAKSTNSCDRTNIQVMIFNTNLKLAERV